MIRTGGGELTGVRKRFGHRSPWVLDGIDLQLPRGSRTVVVGPNGSGKSTLLRIAAGVSLPTGGSVARPGLVSFVPERTAARLRFTAEEYLFHIGDIRGLGRPRITARSRELFDRLGLSPDANAPIDVLSKGNKQKVIIAQALLAPVEMVVMDEPGTGLDPPALRALEQLMDEQRRNGAALLVTSHSVDRVGVDDRVYRLAAGRLERISRSEVDAAARRSSGRRRIELVPRGDPVARDDLRGMTGVLSADHDETRGSLVLVVDSESSDLVLAQLLGAGWSVRSVSPIESRDR